jgi:2-polyprenyl-3-methyl-5-hydroxy-6-metoxy-1,4-benzoquinol methylase
VTEWDTVAESYDQLQGQTGDPYRRLIVDPALFQLLGSIRGLNILDAGCGNGYLAKQLHTKGAHVRAFDSSVQLVERARQRFPEIEVQEMDLTQPLAYKNQTFDLVICHLVFQDLPDLALPLREFHRILKKNGRLIISVLHPCFAYPATLAVLSLVDWFCHRPARLVVNKYLEEKPITSIIPGLPEPTTRYHRQLGTYVQAFTEAGWLIRSLTEPVAIHDLHREDQVALTAGSISPAYTPVYLTQSRGVPITLIFELVRS